MYPEAGRVAKDSDPALQDGHDFFGILASLVTVPGGG